MSKRPNCIIATHWLEAVFQKSLRWPTATHRRGAGGESTIPMRWDAEAKERLYQVLNQKFKELELTAPDLAAVDEKWEQFFISFGILKEEESDQASQAEYVLIKDPGPFFDDYTIKIPKETAEKFLVLGIP